MTLAQLPRHGWRCDTFCLCLWHGLLAEIFWAVHALSQYSTDKKIRKALGQRA